MDNIDYYYYYPCNIDNTRTLTIGKLKLGIKTSPKKTKTKQKTHESIYNHLCKEMILLQQSSDQTQHHNPADKRVTHQIVRRTF